MATDTMQFEKQAVETAERELKEARQAFQDAINAYKAANDKLYAAVLLFLVIGTLVLVEILKIVDRIKAVTLAVYCYVDLTPCKSEKPSQNDQSQKA